MCLELVVGSFVFGGVCFVVVLVSLFFLLKIIKYGFRYFVVVVVWGEVSRL